MRDLKVLLEIARLEGLHIGRKWIERDKVEAL